MAHRDGFLLSALFGDTKSFAFVERVHIGGIQVNEIWRIKQLFLEAEGW